MLPDRCSKFFSSLLYVVYVKVRAISLWSVWAGRLLALPLALFILVAVPVQKFASFVEGIVSVFVNLFRLATKKKNAPLQTWISLKYTGFFLVGFLLSPFSAFFAATALFTTMVIDPVKTSSKFLESCRL